MKAPSQLVLALAIGALALQGCSGTSATRPESQPDPASAPVMSVATASAADVPEQDGKPVIKADSKENFEAIVAAIHQQMQPGGRWQFIDKSERNTINGAFADMAKLYDQFGSVDKMGANAKMRMLSDQSTVNAILTRRDGDRLICKNELPVGSHLPVKTCKTYAQVQAEQRGASEMLRTLNTTGGQLNQGGGAH